MEKLELLMLCLLCIQLYMRRSLASDTSNPSYQIFENETTKLGPKMSTMASVMSEDLMKSQFNKNTLASSSSGWQDSESENPAAKQISSAKLPITTIRKQHSMSFTYSVPMHSSSSILELKQSPVPSRKGSLNIDMPLGDSEVSSLKSETLPTSDHFKVHIAAASKLLQRVAGETSAIVFYTRPITLLTESFTIKPSVASKSFNIPSMEVLSQIRSLYSSNHSNTYKKTPIIKIHPNSFAPDSTMSFNNDHYSSDLQPMFKLRNSLISTTHILSSSYSYITYMTLDAAATTSKVANKRFQKTINSIKTTISANKPSTSLTAKSRHDHMGSSMQVIGSSLHKTCINPTKCLSESAKITSSSWHTKTDYDNKIPKETAKRGIPAWIIIMTAASAFLAITVISAVVFKFIKWNKDHGDYTLWVSNMELQPINSRNAEILT